MTKKSCDGKQQTLVSALTDACALIDGWNQGECWSDWDADVRRRLGEELAKLVSSETTTIWEQAAKRCGWWLLKRSASFRDQMVEDERLCAFKDGWHAGRASAQSANALLDESGKFFDWGNAASVALKNLLDAYERRIRTDCTPEQLALKPWECMEFIEARRILDAKPNWVFTLSTYVSCDSK